MTVKQYIEENKKLPQELNDLVLNNTYIWENDACYGYTIIAMKAAGYDREQISEILRFLHFAMEDYSVSEAAAKRNYF